MSIECVVNKRSVGKNKALKQAQKMTRKYYNEKLFIKAINVPRAKIGKLSDLSRVEYKIISDLELSDEKKEKITKDELISLCQKGSLTGRSGNGFDVSRKIEAFHKNNGTLIINAVECDPGLVTDSWLYNNRKNLIEQGAMFVKGALCLDKIILATKEPIQKIDGIQQVKVIDRFPMGYEKYLIKHILGVEISDDEIPQDKGIIVMNLQTVIAIAELTQNIMAGQYKYITVGNLYSANAKVARVRIGDSVDKIVASCFSQSELENSHIYVGGGALSCHEAVEGEVILDTTGYVAIGEMPFYEEAGKCKGCGACTRNCPAGVAVHKIVKYADESGMNDASKCTQYNASACIGCGACTYGCKANKDVRKVVAWAKRELY